jgi:hypothetical protein
LLLIIFIDGLLLIVNDYVQCKTGPRQINTSAGEGAAAGAAEGAAAAAEGAAANGSAAATAGRGTVVSISVGIDG